MLEQIVFGVVFADKGLHRFVLLQFDVLQRVGGDEAVLADHDGQTHVGGLTDAVGHQIVVIGLLIVLGVDLDKAGVPLGHGVGVVMVDIDGAGQSAAGHGQHDGQAGGGGHIEYLVHEGQARGGGGGNGAASGGLGADAGGHGGVFALHADELGVHLAVGHILGEILGDLGGGGNGEHGEHVRVDLAHGGGDGLVAAQSVSNAHNQWTSFQSMAPKGHTL